MRPTETNPLRSGIARAMTAAVLGGFLLLAASPASAQLSRVGESVLAMEPGGYQRGVDAAHDPVNDVYLVVIGYGQVRGVFVSPSGVPVSASFTIFDGGTGFGKLPRAIYSPDLSNGAGGTGGFLVVWHQDIGTPNYVYGRVVAYEAPSKLVSGPFAISDSSQSGTWWENWPAIAYSRTSKRFLVAWATVQWGVMGRFLDSSGAPTGSVMLFENPGGSQNASLAWNAMTDEFGLAYSQFNSTSAWVGFRRIPAATGAPSARTSFGYAGGTFATSVGVNPDTGRYIVAWALHPGTMTALFEPSGGLVSTTFVTSRTGYDLSLGMAFNPFTGTFLVTGSDSGTTQIGAVELDGSGEPKPGYIVATNDDSKGSFYPLPAPRKDTNQWAVAYNRNYLQARTQIIASASVNPGGCSVGATATVPSAGVMGTPVSFAATATVSGCGGAAATFAWTFGDGGTSASQAPTHAYAVAGTYTWTLTVQAGTATDTKTGTIVISDPSVCTVGATATVPGTGTAGSPVAFAATSTVTGCGGASPAYAWSFGDGSTSALQNPSHTYAAAGTFTWTLTVTAGSGTATRTGTITVSAPAGCSSTTHTVQAQTSASLSAMWQGTGVMATAGQLLTISAPGTWTNGGTAWTAAGNASDPTGAVNSPMPGAPRMALVGRIGTAGNPFLVGTFLQTTPGASGELFLAPNDDWYQLWDNAGSLTVSVCTGGTPCSVIATATVQKTGVPGSVINFASTASASNCGGAALTFAWAFGDGGTSALQNPTHAYTAAGTYTWTLTVQSSTATATRTGTVAVSAPARFGDYDGDGKSDLIVFRPATGAWYVKSNAGLNRHIWGTEHDVPVHGDFDGDRKADIAVFRPATGAWYVLQSSTGFTSSVKVVWGGPGDIPIPADYDGDGTTDIAVFRPSTGTWYIRTSTTNSEAPSSLTFVWGLGTDLPVPGDYDGDGKADIAVYRPSTNAWYILKSIGGYSSTTRVIWGAGKDLPVPGDYDGDGKTDVAVYRPSTGAWYLNRSTAGAAKTVWGTATDWPVPADYDGDGTTDVAVFRPSTGAWYLKGSTAGASSAVWGTGIDVPAGVVKPLPDTTVRGDHDGDRRADLTVWRPTDMTWRILKSGSEFTKTALYTFGASGDMPVPGDYDGDGTGDLAVWRATSGDWLVMYSSMGFASGVTQTLGANGDVPVPGDYDGDGKTDFAVYRSTTGSWYVRQSTTGAVVSFALGGRGYQAAPGDYDGDGLADPAVFETAAGRWYILKSSAGFTWDGTFTTWGSSGDVPVPGDFDGDGRADIAVFRSSTGEWFILKSTTDNTAGVVLTWGTDGDEAVPGDYDGDGKVDVAIWRPSTGAWYILKSITGFLTSMTQTWGQQGDIPPLRRQ